MKIPFLSKWLAGHRLMMAGHRLLRPVKLSRDVKNALDDATEAAVNVWLNRRDMPRAQWRGRIAGAFVEELGAGQVILIPRDTGILRWKLLHAIIGNAIQGEYSHAMDPYRRNPVDLDLRHEKGVDAAAKEIAKELARLQITMQRLDAPIVRVRTG